MHCHSTQIDPIDYVHGIVITKNSYTDAVSRYRYILETRTIVQYSICDCDIKCSETIRRHENMISTCRKDENANV